MEEGKDKNIDLVVENYSYFYLSWSLFQVFSLRYYKSKRQRNAKCPYSKHNKDLKIFDVLNFFHYYTNYVYKEERDDNYNMAFRLSSKKNMIHWYFNATKVYYNTSNIIFYPYEIVR